MSFEFTVLSDDRFIEILEAWVDSPWPKTAEDGYALGDQFGWTPDYREPALFTSDVRPHESSSYFTARDGKIKSLKIPVTDIAPEEARGDSLEDALVIYRHFCDILKSRYGKPKQRKNRNGFYEALYISPQGVGINPGGVVPSLSATLSLLRRCLLPASMRVWSLRAISRRMSSTGGWSRRPGSPGLGLTAGVLSSLVVPRGRGRLLP